MFGWRLLKEEPTSDKVSHLISEVTSGGKSPGAVLTPALCSVSLICPGAVDLCCWSQPLNSKAVIIHCRGGSRTVPCIEASNQNKIDTWFT